MVLKTSDIEEIEVDADPPAIYDEDSNSNSNLSEPGPSSRTLRQRNSKSKIDDRHDNQRESHRPKRYNKIVDKDLTDFLGNFDQNTSERERKKQQKAFNYKDNKRGNKKDTTVFDEKGILVYCKKDLCDCMDDTCPGCHFPCPKCRSNKCGHECRQNRKWIFDSVELDGIPGSLKDNPYSKEFQVTVPEVKSEKFFEPVRERKISEREEIVPIKVVDIIPGIEYEPIRLGKGNYQCPICSKTMVARNLMEMHIRVHTGEKPFQCPFCNETYAQKGNCKQHILSKHNKSNEPIYSRQLD